MAGVWARRSLTRFRKETIMAGVKVATIGEGSSGVQLETGQERGKGYEQSGSERSGGISDWEHGWVGACCGGGVG